MSDMSDPQPAAASMSGPTAAPDRARLEARVHGRVQGVGFRHFVRLRASALGLVGWVSNEPDGSVAVIAEGPRDALEALVRLLSEGPSGARVEDVGARWLDARGEFSRFGVRAGGHSGD